MQTEAFLFNDFSLFGSCVLPCPAFDSQVFPRVLFASRVLLLFSVLPGTVLPLGFCAVLLQFSWTGVLSGAGRPPVLPRPEPAKATRVFVFALSSTMGTATVKPCSTHTHLDHFFCSVLRFLHPVKPPSLAVLQQRGARVSLPACRLSDSLDSLPWVSQTPLPFPRVL